MNSNVEYKTLSTKDLLIDPLYQREVDMSRVNKIVKEFNPMLVNPVKVSFRDGKYYIFDGQHTAAALKLRNKGHDLYIQCCVYYGLTWLDEVELFLQQNGISRSVNMNDKFKALYNSGNREVIKMVKACERHGIRIDFSHYKGDYRIVALSTLYRIFCSMPETDFDDMISIIIEAWKGTKESLSNEILKGMYKFYQTYKGQFSRKKLIDRLADTTPSVIIREAKASYTPGDAKYARQILRLYNYRAKHTLDDKL